MKKSGAELLVYALEQIGVQYTFGIPGVHNTEIYDQLNSNEQIEPILVTHEVGASFMGLGVSCTSPSVGTVVIVPAAGVTHAMSGIGEAFLDGIPLLVISGGTRRDSGRSYQLHQLDHKTLVQAITKKYYLIEDHSQIIPVVYKAYQDAIQGEPGPVFIEVPVEIQLFRGSVKDMPTYKPLKQLKTVDEKQIHEAVEHLTKAKNPGIYVGWGAVDATEYIIKIAESLSAPVCTTLQGKSAFPASHPLHTGFGFGPNAVPASQKAFKHMDLMLAVGVRFSEIGTGSYGAKVPENLIHIDINSDVFNKNYPAILSIEGDASEVMKLIAEGLSQRNSFKEPDKKLIEHIKKAKEDYSKAWKKGLKKDIVSPGYFFESLQKYTDNDTYIVVDDGLHTYLAAELMPVEKGRHFISPTDFNCMGFCVPAAIGTKLSNRDKKVVGIVGDGAFMMTGMELITAVTHRLDIIYFVFHDGELGQIAQLQEIPLNRKTATVIGDLNLKGIAEAVGAHFVSIDHDHELDEKMKKAFDLSSTNLPVLVDVKIDYEKKTFMTKGVVKANLSRFSLSEKIRFISRAIKRHVVG
ncbi:thiamine pyrophosphate-binding protein [Aestuariivivens sediminicola]|uniref:thiamine pyrophosphate-binding protein n=1 Tax=Aestuariivivens sediminicola TaxID=2913560 RepID=UPI001F5757C3|nr:thiamine pyrophosphate-binding protein [Aestuariivivens sediminicola]